MVRPSLSTCCSRSRSSRRNRFTKYWLADLSVVNPNPALFRNAAGEWLKRGSGRGSKLIGSSLSEKKTTLGAKDINSVGSQTNLQLQLQLKGCLSECAKICTSRGGRRGNAMVALQISGSAKSVHDGRGAKMGILKTKSSDLKCAGGTPAATGRKEEMCKDYGDSTAIPFRP